jgi:hypothetical protein
MGADLYIQKLDETRTHGGFEVSKEAVDDGYFRDCYNSSGLFSMISANTGKELSWWITAGRKELFTKDGRNMTVKGSKQFLAEIEPIIAEFKALPKLYSSEYNMGKRRSEKGKKIKDIKQYHEWADLLVNFLKLAIEKKSQIIWSV